MPPHKYAIGEEVIAISNVRAKHIYSSPIIAEAKRAAIKKKTPMIVKHHGDVIDSCPSYYVGLGRHTLEFSERDLIPSMTADESYLKRLIGGM